ncbi:MAG TPA: aminoacyl--tRNA ligase-related protein, partial [Patescibacteria group bacterium]|nr:aminoacyl--tRNA ligase-related protein [Patescibacteria group bacterium]
MNYIRENTDLVKKTIRQKGLTLDVDQLMKIDSARRDIIGRIEKHRKRRNEIADQLKDESQRTPALINEGKKVKDDIKKLEESFEPIEREFNALLLLSPTVPSSDTPVGGEEANKEIKTWGAIPKFDFDARDHMELARINEWIDFERGVKVHGYRGYFLKNQGALAQMRLLSYAFEKMAAKGYMPMIPPTIVKDFTLYGTGFFPFGEGDSFEIGNAAEQETGELIKDRLYLAGTAEVGIAGYFANETFEESQLPVRVVGYSPCYRREVGGYGRDTKGIYSIHEFFKI